MPIKIVDGNLLDATETYLCHQVNCVTRKAAHLAQQVFKKFPYADLYRTRTQPDLPGGVICSGNGQNQRLVVNMLGQVHPGYAKWPNDSYPARLGFFKGCLDALEFIVALKGESLAFPWKIGCGAAGGDWTQYLPLIEDFARDKDVTLYRLGV